MTRHEPRCEALHLRTDGSFGPQAGGKPGDGRPLMVIGLSAETIRRLRANQPIHFDAAPLGVDATVVIIAGETDQDLVEDLFVRLVPSGTAHSGEHRIAEQ